MIKVTILLMYIPTGELYAEGVQLLENEEQFDQLKDLMSEAVRGKLAFIKIGGKTDQFVGKEMLIKSKIILDRCEQ